MQKRWIIRERRPGDFPSELAGKYNRLVLELLRSRGIDGFQEVESFFTFDYAAISDPLKISGINLLIERIELARDQGEKVAVFGDYDADGVTASVLMMEALENLGFSDLTYYIPDRQLEGYGMNDKAVDYLRGLGVSLIITVDSGITNFLEVARAKEKGIDVIVTDHHHIPEKIPEAVAVINPHLENSGFQFADLAGVGVAFKVVQALYQKMEPGKIEQLKWMLDLVAIGTVADCVPLLGENRLLVKYGLIVLSKTRRVGLQEMFKVGRIDISENNIPNTHKIAFQISPRINAAGRMEHANVAYRLILEKDRVQARTMALELEAKNHERQKMMAEIVKEIEAVAKKDFQDKKFILAKSPHWPVGILGLVAGKMVEKSGKPVLAFQEQEGLFVGSLRSIPELNIMEVLERCSDLLLKFGGHSQAAGVRIAPENMVLFSERIAQIFETEISDQEFSSLVQIDLEVFPEEINWELVSELHRLEPFGMGNTEPTFLMRELEVLEARVVGNGGKHLKISLYSKKSRPKIFDAIGFSMGEEFSNISKGELVDVVFNLAEDEWNGSKKIQLKLVDLRRS